MIRAALAIGLALTAQHIAPIAAHHIANPVTIEH